MHSPKSDFIDLSHTFEDGMPGFRLQNEDGSYTEYTAEIRPFLTHDETGPLFEEGCSFEITEMTFQTSVGTYLDSPFHRYPEGRDISEIVIDELVLPGVVVDVRDCEPREAVGVDVLPSNRDLAGRAVLFNFGWDEHWKTEQYRSYPYISERLVDRLIASDVALVGVDTINIDDDSDLARPAHTGLLENDIFITENLCELDRLREVSFRFSAVPLKARGAAAMPVRAFAEVDESHFETTGPAHEDRNTASGGRSQYQEQRNSVSESEGDVDAT